MFNFLKNLGTTELIIIAVIIIVFFGAKRIADLGKAGGETVKEIKKIKKELIETDSKAERKEVEN